MAESHFLYSFPAQLGSSKRRESTFFKVPNLSTIHSVNLSNAGETIVQATGNPDSKSQRHNPTAQLCQGDFVPIKPTKESFFKNSNYAFSDSFGSRLARGARESSYVAGREHTPTAGCTRLHNELYEVSPTNKSPARSSIPKQHAKVDIQESTLIDQSNLRFNQSNKKSMFVQNGSIRQEGRGNGKVAIGTKNANIETDDQRKRAESCQIQENVDDLAPKTKITVVQHPEKTMVDARSQFCFPTNFRMKRGSQYFENNRGAKPQPIRRQMGTSTPACPVADEAYETALEDQPSEKVIKGRKESRYCYKMPKINKCSEQVEENNYHPKPPRTITKPTQGAHRSTDEFASSPDAKFHYINNRLSWLNHRELDSAKDHNEPEKNQYPSHVNATANQHDVQENVGTFEEEQYIEAIEKAKNQNFRSQFCGQGFSGLLRNRGSVYATDLSPSDISNQFGKRLSENRCHQQQHPLKMDLNCRENQIHQHQDEATYSPNDERSGYVFLQNNMRPTTIKRYDIPNGTPLKQGTHERKSSTKQHEACQYANASTLPAEQANMLNFNGVDNDVQWAQDRLPIPVMPKDSGYLFQNIEHPAESVRPASNNPGKPGMLTLPIDKKVGLKAGSKKAEMINEQVEDNQIHDHNVNELGSDSASSVKYSQYLFRNKNQQLSKNCGKAILNNMAQQNHKSDINSTNSKKSSENGSRSHNSIPMPMDVLKQEHKDPVMSKFLMDYDEADYSTNTLIQLDRCSPFPKETARGVADGEVRTSGDFKTIGTKKESLRVFSNKSDLKPKITIVNMKNKSNSSDHKDSPRCSAKKSKPKNQNSANVSPTMTKNATHLPFVQPQNGLDQRHGFADPYWPLLQNSPFVPPPFWNQPMTSGPGGFYPQMYHPFVNAQMNWNPHMTDGYDSSETTESNMMPGRMEPNI